MALADAAVRDRMFLAHEQLKDTIENKSLRDYTSSVFRDAQITIIRLQKGQEHVDELMGLNRLTAFLEQTQKFEVLLGRLFDGPDSQKLCSCIWGSLRFVLEVSHSKLACVSLC